MSIHIGALAVLLALLAAPIEASEQRRYAPARVVYDVSTPDPQQLKLILDRVSHLQNLYSSDPFSASIVIVLHEGAIPLFARKHKQFQHALVARSQGLTLGEIIQFRLCQASATMQGLDKTDFDSFIELVPMADAEIVRLQHDGHAYLH